MQKRHETGTSDVNCLDCWATLKTSLTLEKHKLFLAVRSVSIVRSWISHQEQVELVVFIESAVCQNIAKNGTAKSYKHASFLVLPEVRVCNLNSCVVCKLWLHSAPVCCGLPLDTEAMVKVTDEIGMPNLNSVVPSVNHQTRMRILPEDARR